VLINKRGFTLIELLIVIAIVGIVAAIAIPNLLMALQRGKQKATCATLKNIGIAIETYIANCEFVPNANTAGVTVAGAGNLEGTLEPFYVKIMPTRDGWNYPLYYYSGPNSGSDKTEYSIRSYGRDGQPSSINRDNNNYIVDSREDFNLDIIYSQGGFSYGPRN